MMTKDNSFTDAVITFGGSVRGAEPWGHDLFKILRPEAPILFGEYILVFPNNGDAFNIEIGYFGYRDRTPQASWVIGKASHQKNVRPSNTWSERSFPIPATS
jgi:hypothetical protein